MRILGRLRAGPDHRSTSVPVILAVAALVLFLLLLVVDGRPRGNVNTGDTEGLVDGARFGLRCLAGGPRIRCGLVSGKDVSEVSAYPLLQYLPAVPMIQLGWDDQAVVDGLAALNLAAFFGCLACIVVVGRRLLPGWAPVLLAAILSGPLLFYSTAGFGEMLVTFLALAFLTFTILRRPVPAAVALALACVGKDTITPFLVGLGLLCLWAPDVVPGPPPRARRTMVAAVVGGATAGVAATVAFNLFRYGSALNLFYMDDRSGRRAWRGR